MKTNLFVVGTPIGNLGDISKRALEVLRSVDLILAEDTRRVRKLLQHYEIHAKVISCHQFNEVSRIKHVLADIDSGTSIALVSNAGMPCISDPGARIISACREHGVGISVIPGASSVTAAIALCGFGGDRFLFEGFLSRKKNARKRRLTELQRLPYPVVLFESPYRCLALLVDLDTIFGDRTVFLARELTKINEECLCGTALELHSVFLRRADQYMLQTALDKHKAGARSVRGEIVFVIAPASKCELKTTTS